MKKFNLIFCVLFFWVDTGFARTPNQNNYIAGKNPRLNQKEKQSLKISSRWRDGNKFFLNPAEGKNGTVMFIYGADQPSVVCAITQICDIALEPGETVNKDGLHIGDPARWSVTPSISGYGLNKQMHLIIKPRGWVGNSTTLFIATNKRTYHIKLLSHKRDYMPRVAFVYPNQERALWDLYQNQVNVQEENLIMPETKQNIAQLDFEYKIKGKTRWKPVRVYNDGIRTYIQLPPNVHQTESPSLLIVDKTNQEQIVNYRLRDNRYIVDQIFEKAILVAGVGRHQEKITIIKKD